jgi:hypothetical protein
MIDKKAIQVFKNFDAADEADRQERWNMSVPDRLRTLEQLRQYMYPHGESPPRLQRLLESAEFPPS